MFFTSTKLKWTNLFFLLCLSVFVKAQVKQAGRLDIPISQDIETYAVVPLDSAGIVLYRNFTGPDGDKLELTRIDTALQQVWKGFMPVPKGYLFISAKAANGKIYFFYNGWPQAKEFLVFSVNIADGSYLTHPVKNYISFNATEFVANKYAILIGGYFNFRPIVLYYSLRDNRSRMLPGFLNEPGELTQIKPYANGNVDVITSAKNASRKKCIWVRSYDSSGDLMKTIILEPEESKNLIFGRAVKTANGNQVIAGVYGRNSEYARGIFVADVNEYGEYAIHYYNFADLQNFFHYMKAKRERRIKERIERRKVKGKKVKFNYRFLVHEVIPYKDQYVLLGEAFFVRYSNRPNYYMPTSSGFYSPWSYNLAGRFSNPYRNDLVFDGFQYTHAVAIGFDKSANLEWDNSFEINDIKSFQLEQFVKIFPGEDHILLVYQYENFIRTKIIKDNQVIEGTLENAVKLSNGLQVEKKSTHLSKLEYWYSNYFLSSGVQTVTNQNVSQKVFFINKLRAR